MITSLARGRKAFAAAKLCGVRRRRMRSLNSSIERASFMRPASEPAIGVGFRPEFGPLNKERRASGSSSELEGSQKTLRGHCDAIGNDPQEVEATRKCERNQHGRILRTHRDAPY